MNLEWSLMLKMVFFSRLVSPGSMDDDKCAAGQPWKKMGLTAQRLKGEYNTTEVRTIWSCSATCTDDRRCISFGFDEKKSICLLYSHLVWQGGEILDDPDKGGHFLYYWKFRRTCPVNYKFKNDLKFCYKYVSTEKPWREAMEQCLDEGGHLGVLDSEDKYKFLISENILGLYGATNLNNDGLWKWVTGDSVNYFGRGEPNNYLDKENCYILNSKGGNDEDCRRSSPYLCEIPVL